MGRNWINKLSEIIDNAEDVNSKLEDLGNELSTLESIDWDEVFENVPNGNSMKKDVTVTIDAIADILNEITGR